ncbi:methionine biosynthesis protein MetW [Candidatus Electronema sp. TJ]|uniref:methionine biosynthesis protein MetW n=1 Tax=Candidatus Electronema sp. TJ TaxID=3401573 RepID=UPI003AA97EAA
MRFDLHMISSWITPGSRVLDLGCGKGDLLFYLQTQKQVRGVGIEQDEDNAAFCISRGLSVLHGNFIEEVADYPDNHFDYIVLSQTLQQVYAPEKLLQALLTVGSRVIVSFPNFSHWQVRLQLLLTGAAPRNEQFPYEWHNTPNIRIITLRDFRIFVRKIHGVILKSVAISSHHHETQGRIVRRFPNWRSTYGIFMIAGGSGGALPEREGRPLPPFSS